MDARGKRMTISVAKGFSVVSPMPNFRPHPFLEQILSKRSESDEIQAPDKVSSGFF